MRATLLAATLFLSGVAAAQSVAPADRGPPHRHRSAGADPGGKGRHTPTAALVSATTAPAELMGLSDEIGTIAPDKVADIIAVSGDTLTDPRVLLKMRFVMAAGRTIPLD
jgi:imidazolonepropionase-like amidohydrolase